MKRILVILITLIAGIVSSYTFTSYASVAIPGTAPIIENSMVVNTGVNNGSSIAAAKDFGLRIIGAVRIAVSGVALIWMVMIGVYTIIGSDNEETVKTQKKQITYVLIGFLFLNVPSFVYTVFMPEDGKTIGTETSWATSSSNNNVFWNTAGFEGVIGDMIAFLRVFAFGVAVLMFTWGFFALIISGGDDEKRKMAKNRIIYGIVGLMFLGFVQFWGQLVAMGDFTRNIPNVVGVLFGLVMYFAAPIAIFMLIWGSYLIITSAGDEERVKKGKSIFINTGIASIILLVGLSFMTDLVKFQF